MVLDAFLTLGNAAIWIVGAVTVYRYVMRRRADSRARCSADPSDTPAVDRSCFGYLDKRAS